MTAWDAELLQANNLSQQAAQQLQQSHELTRLHLDRLLESGWLDGRTPGRIDVTPPPAAAEKLLRAHDLYRQALAAMPKGITANVAVLHHQLGGICQSLNRIDAAIHHFHQAIRLHSLLGDRLRAGQARLDFANCLIHRGARYPAALVQARAALLDLQSHSPRPDREIDRATGLITEIRRFLRPPRGSRSRRRAARGAAQ
jgi:tetratricopeptide (TPR) repeat protein